MGVFFGVELGVSLIFAFCLNKIWVTFLEHCFEIGYCAIVSGDVDAALLQHRKLGSKW